MRLYVYGTQNFKIGSTSVLCWIQYAIVMYKISVLAVPVEGKKEFPEKHKNNSKLGMKPDNNKWDHPINLLGSTRQ